MHHVCAGVLNGQVVRSPEAGVTFGCELCHGVLGAKASPLQEQPVLLAAEHSQGPCLLLKQGLPVQPGRT